MGEGERVKEGEQQNRKRKRWKRRRENEAGGKEGHREGGE